MKIVNRLRRYVSPLAGDTASTLNLPPVRMGLLTKLNLLTVGLIFLTAVALSVFHFAQQWREDEQQLRSQGATMLGVMAQLAEYGLATGDKVYLEQMLDGVSNDPDVAYALALMEIAAGDVEAAAIGQQVVALEAATGREIDAAFEGLEREKVDALFVSGGAFFAARRAQLAILAARYALPAIYSQRLFVEVGGLMSYGTNLADAWRQQGAYAGRILKGAKPADLPVVQASKFELVINAETARMLGLTVSPLLLTIADEVIE
jgi:hypothetical protein